MPTGFVFNVLIRGKKLKLTAPTKADAARELFGQGDYTVTEVSKALDMAYSQAHTIHKKIEGDRGLPRATAARRQMPPPSPYREAREQAKAVAKATKVLSKPKLRPGIGKLRTPGLPNDIEVGECANCGHDLVVRPLPTGYTLVHVNTTAEEHLAVTQFCQAVPRRLVK